MLGRNKNFRKVVLTNWGGIPEHFLNVVAASADTIDVKATNEAKPKINLFILFSLKCNIHCIKY